MSDELDAAGPPLNPLVRSYREWRSDRPKLAIVMVGLPARGKSYIARRLARYLGWTGIHCVLYNVGNFRRQLFGAEKGADWFSPTNEQAMRERSFLAATVLTDMIMNMTTSDTEVSLFDATNTTRARRRMICDRLREAGIEPLFVETVATRDDFVEANIREAKLSSPDYVNVSADEAVIDFKARIAHYQTVYEPMSEEEGVPFIRYEDVGRRVVLFQIQGFLVRKIAFFVTHLNVAHKPIFFCRHGESAFNQRGLIGGDSDLSENGVQFAKRLAKFLEFHGYRRIMVFTSTLRRTIQTAQHIPGAVGVQWGALDELHAGVFDGRSYEYIKLRHPRQHEAREADKLRYRYPRGESYEDVIARLETVILELERLGEPVLVISHQAVMRALLAYFESKSAEECPHLDVPLHTVIRLVPKAYACEETRYTIDRDDVENIEPRVVCDPKSEMSKYIQHKISFLDRKLLPGDLEEESRKISHIRNRSTGHEFEMMGGGDSS